MRTTSCGIVVLNPGAEILLCHATGTPYWDIPKGAGDPGENEMQTALREAAEETSLAFDAAGLLDLGRFAYRPRKDLHLYATLVERFDTGVCRCASHFTDARGRVRLEMDAFEWVELAHVGERCAPSMTALLTRTLSLQDVLERLQGAGMPPGMPARVGLPPTLEPTASASRSPGR